MDSKGVAKFKSPKRMKVRLPTRILTEEKSPVEMGLADDGQPNHHFYMSTPRRDENFPMPWDVSSVCGSAHQVQPTKNMADNNQEYQDFFAMAEENDSYISFFEDKMVDENIDELKKQTNELLEPSEGNINSKKALLEEYNNQKKTLSLILERFEIETKMATELREFKDLGLEDLSECIETISKILEKSRGLLKLKNINFEVQEIDQLVQKLEEASEDLRLILEKISKQQPTFTERLNLLMDVNKKINEIQECRSRCEKKMIQHNYWTIVEGSMKFSMQANKKKFKFMKDDFMEFLN